MKEMEKESYNNNNHGGQRKLHKLIIWEGGFSNLSKAFDCIEHELLIAKLYAYGFDENSLYFINSYLKGQQERNCINSYYSAFAEIPFGVRQGSILGPLLFNIYICDLFLENSDIDIANYDDGNTPYACSSDLNSVFFKL